MLVFRKNLYLQSEDIKDKSDVWKELCSVWVEYCDGKTKGELVAEGIDILDEWCEDVPPVYNPCNPWRTFDELPVDSPFLLVKIKKYVYRAAYYNKVNDTITTTKGSISRKEAFAEGFKWKYIEDDEIPHK